MRAASAGMMLLRHLLQPFLLEPLPVTLAENLVTYNMKPVAVARSRDEDCDICRNNPQAGFGDCGETIGFDKETAKALVDWVGVMMTVADCHFSAVAPNHDEIAIRRQAERIQYGGLQDTVYPVNRPRIRHDGVPQEGGSW